MAAAKNLNVVLVPIASISPDPNQPRTVFDKAALGALTESVKTRGVLVPLLVRRDGKKTVVVDGERRLRAATAAKLKSVPVLYSDASDNRADLGVTQVVINNLRAELKPMEVARWVAALHRDDKLSANEIAARLTKAGIESSPNAISESLRLVSLPSWAQTLIDDGTVESAAALKLLDVPKDKTAQEAARKYLEHRVQWSGRADKGDVQGAVRNALDRVGVDLANTWDLKNAVRFDARKRCVKCEFYRPLGASDKGFCLNRELFKTHNAEAKAAGLGPGGAPAVKATKDKPLTAAQQRRHDDARAEQRDMSLSTRASEYLRRYCQTLISTRCREGDELWLQLALFMAFGEPGARSHSGASIWKLPGQRRDIAKGRDLKSIEAFMDLKGTESHLYAVGVTILGQLDWQDTQAVAHHILGKDLTAFWRWDADYLALLQKKELAAVLDGQVENKGGKPWEGAKLDVLRDVILANADALATPKLLAGIYSTIEERFVDDDLPDDDDEPVFDDDDDVEIEDDAVDDAA